MDTDPLSTSQVKVNKKGNESQALSKYKIRKALLSKQGRKYADLYMCPGCFKRKGLKLYKVNENGDTLLCQDCIDKEKEEQRERKAEREEELLNQRVKESKQRLLQLEKQSFKAPVLTPQEEAEPEKTHYLYSIRKAVLKIQNGRCKECGEKKDDLDLLLIRERNKGSVPKVEDYVILCADCILKKTQRKWKQKPRTYQVLRKRKGNSKAQEEKKENRIWIRRAKGERGGSPASSKTSFLNSIRKLVYQRDGYKCVFCEALGKAKNPGGLALTSLIAESKSGRVCFDNYVTCCASHRSSKSDKLPVEYIWGEIGLQLLCSEELEDGVTTKNLGARVNIDIHLWGRYDKLLAMIAVCKNLEELVKIRDTAEQLQIDFCKSDEDRKRERGQFNW